MVKQIPWDHFTKFAKDTYSDIESLERIKPPDKFKPDKSRFPSGFPGTFTADWWALRRRFELLMHSEQSRLRNGDEPPARELAEAAKQAALGLTSGETEYQAADPETGLPLLESPAMRTMRENDPPRYAALVAEARRLVALGRPNVRTHLAKPMP